MEDQVRQKYYCYRRLGVLVVTSLLQGHVAKKVVIMKDRLVLWIL